MTKVKLGLLTDINMLLIVEKGIRRGMYQAIYQYARANKKYIKGYDKSKESSYFQYWGVNNLYGQAKSQKLYVNNFKQVEDTFEFNKDFIKNYNDESGKGYFQEDDVEYPENLHNLYYLHQKIYPFCLKE